MVSKSIVILIIVFGTSSSFSICCFFGTSSGFGTILLPKPEEVPNKNKNCQNLKKYQKTTKNKDFAIFRPGGLQDMKFLVFFCFVFWYLFRFWQKVFGFFGYPFRLWQYFLAQT